MKKTLFAAVLVTVVTFSGGLLLTTFPARRTNELH